VPRVITQRPKYWLSKGTHACVAGTHVVLLDLRKDRYFTIDAGRGAGLSTVIANWPLPTEQRTPGEPFLEDRDEAVQAVTAQMLSEGLLAREYVGASCYAPKNSAWAPKPPELPAGVPKTRLSHLVKFARAVVLAYVELKALPIRIVIRRFHSKQGSRFRAGTPGARYTSFELACIFARIRMYVFRSRDACLFESLALAHFLRHFGLHSSLFFGVRDSPFCAHCWLVHDGTLLNDTPENVRGYTPILQV
jgi:hypothetical protein